MHMVVKNIWAFSISATADVIICPIPKIVGFAQFCNYAAENALEEIDHIRTVAVDIIINKY